MKSLVKLKRKVKDWLYIHVKTRLKPFRNSDDYWKSRYKAGKNSGSGSYNELAAFKASFINDFVSQHKIKTIIELGCGDGNQLKSAQYPNYYGLDISEEAIEICRNTFKDDPAKRFDTMEMLKDQVAELSLSLDVIYHLVEDQVFESYMASLFKASNAYVIIYSSDTEQQMKLQAPHVRHRKFSNWIAKHLPDWELFLHEPNAFPYEGDDTKGSLADFYVYRKR